MLICTTSLTIVGSDRAIGSLRDHRHRHTRRGSNGIPVSQARTGILAHARLRDLYEHQHVPVTEIAQMRGAPP
jgi:hypothetical protein